MNYSKIPCGPVFSLRSARVVLLGQPEVGLLDLLRAGVVRAVQDSPLVGQRA